MEEKSADLRGNDEKKKAGHHKKSRKEKKKAFGLKSTALTI